MQAGNPDEDAEKKREASEPDVVGKKKNYEVIVQKVEIKKVEKSERTFKVKGGKNNRQELPIFNVSIIINDEEKKVLPTQGLEPGKEEELEIRINKLGKVKLLLLHCRKPIGVSKWRLLKIY